jgi:ral guanine nucleotide dissociation stimulator-like 1
MDRYCPGIFLFAICIVCRLHNLILLQVLRVLKNFSSLKAIISGLQSNPVYRLKKAWASVPKEKLEVFEELARIFSGENNALVQRELLVREGTARFADTVGENDHHMQKILQKHSENSRVIIPSCTYSHLNY